MTQFFKKFLNIFINTIPIISMVGLIAIIKNDYILTLLYIMIIAVALFFKYEKREYVFLVFGFFIMIISEYFFISTGVEVFMRKSLLGVMPLWLPFLWAYGFLAMKRAINILDK